MQTVDAFSQQIFHPGHIITQTVVCGVGDNRMHRLRVNTVFNQRIFTNGFRNCGLSQTIRMYRPIMPYWLREGTKYVGMAPDIVIACSTDL